jgi:ATP-binding cassette subfamily C protein
MGGVGLLARSVGETQLVELEQACLRELARQPEHRARVAHLLETWINGLSSGVARRAAPQRHRLLAAGAELALMPDESVRAGGPCVWAQQRAGGSLFLGSALIPGGGGPFPLSRHGWLQNQGRGQLSGMATEEALRDDAAWIGLESFHRAALECVARNLEEHAAAERQRLRGAAESDRLHMVQSLGQLSSVLAMDATDTALDGAQDSLLAACRLVGAALGVQIRKRRGGDQERAPRDPVGEIAQASRIRARRVALRGEWWRHDHGPLLAFVEENERPVALLPVSPRAYECHDPVAGTQRPVTPELAAALSPFAHTFYRTLPDRAVTAMDLLRLGFDGLQPDLRRVVLAAAAAGALGLAVPIATQTVVDTIIPAADRASVLGLSLVLLVAACAAALLQLALSIALLRIETRSGTAAQAAVWDRLLTLPPAFFRGYAAGELAQRAMGINTIRHSLSGVALSSVLTGVFSMLSLVVLFYLDVPLALLTVAFVVAAVLATALAAALQLRYERQAAVAEASTAGTVVQLVTGISKLRGAGAEPEAFARWARRFVAQRRLTFRARAITNGLVLFNAAFPIVTLIALFAAVALAGPNTRSTGTLLAFLAALSGLLAATVTTSASVAWLVRVVPAFDNLAPILQSDPEVGPSKADPGELGGRVEVSHVSFRYTPDGPLILDNVSLEVNPGEFVALVGPSGSGKSSILRILLGFETPESGSVYYDGQDLAELDLRLVRRQLGIVLQSGKVLPGDIRTNIVGSSLATLSEAWDAARMAGLEDEIKAMPMGMYTTVSEGGSTFSGGQRQRLLIARALVSQPRILLFDEATSALDNRTQAVVSASLARLQTTRIVIAHRLSTIIDADRIYVIDGGRVVQRGTYTELAGQPGLFSDLIRRQML